MEDALLLKKILKFLLEYRNFDFSGYRTSMLQRRVNKRVIDTQSNNLANYYTYLQNNLSEADYLFDTLTINVSLFFRNAIYFEYLSEVILPSIIQFKRRNGDKSIRIWSNGCSKGEEAYSIAIIAKEAIEKEEADININIFATDIDNKAINSAQIGEYEKKSLVNVKSGILEKYFTKKEKYHLAPEIKELVKFYQFDTLNKTRSYPPDSIYGEFDIILCRNVLIYFQVQQQKAIFKKLYKALSHKGYLVLGDAEVPIADYKNYFKRENRFLKIYRKSF